MFKTFCLILTLLIPSVALAAGGEHHPAGIGTLMFPVINFVLFVAVLNWAYRKLARPLLRDRSIQVENQLKDAAQQLREAESLLDTAKRRRAGIESEKTELIEQLVYEGKRVAASTVQNAELSAEGIKKDTVRRIAAELSKAKAEIRAEVIAGATELARNELRTGLSADEDKRLRDDTIRGLVS